MPDKSKAEAFIRMVAENRQQLMHSQFRTALEMLSESLYSTNTHFVYELIQNAEDNEYAAQEPLLRMIIEDDNLKIWNNEKGFTEQNIEALCSVGKSTKKLKASGYIGEKGIGFKSVFKVTDSPRIISSGFAFELSSEDFIVPRVFDADALCEEGTSIVLPIKSDEILEAIRRDLLNLNPLTILFLKKLDTLIIEDRKSDGVSMIRRQRLDHGVVRLSSQQSTQDWLLFSKEVRVPEGLLEPKRIDVKSREVVIGFRVDTDLKCLAKTDNPIFAFLPTQNRPGLPFLVQADFILKTDREDLLKDNSWNSWLLSEIPRAANDAIMANVSEPNFAKTFFKCLPLPEQLNDAYFRGAVQALLISLQSQDVFLSQSGKLSSATHVITADPVVRELFPNEELQNLLRNKIEYLHEECEISPALTARFGIKEFGKKELITILQNEAWLAKQSTDWFQDLYSFLSHSRIKLETHEYKNLPLVVLEDRSLARTADGVIYLPPKEERVEETYGLEQFHWRIVERSIVRRDPNPRSDAARLRNERATKSRDFLVDVLGVSLHRPLNVAYEMILPSLAGNPCKDTSAVQKTYKLVLYLKEHWAEICKACQQTDSRISLNDLLKACEESLPLICVNSDGEQSIKPPSKVYLPPEMGGAQELKLLLKHTDAWFVTEDIWQWDQARVNIEQKKTEWITFLKSVGCKPVLRFRKKEISAAVLDQYTNCVAAEDKVVQVQGELMSPHLQQILEYLTNYTDEHSKPTAKALLKHLDDNWEIFKKSIEHPPDRSWYEVRITSCPRRSARNRTSNDMPCKPFQDLQKQRWLCVDDEIELVRPLDTLIGNDLLESFGVNVGHVLRQTPKTPELIDALGIERNLKPSHIFSALQQLREKGVKDLKAYSKLYLLLDDCRTKKTFSEEDALIFRDRAFIFIPGRHEPFAAIRDCVWQQPSQFYVPGFPAVSSHYPKLQQLMQILGLNDTIDVRRLLNKLEVLSRYACTEKTKSAVAEIYCMLARGERSKNEAPIREFLSRTRLLTDSGKFLPINDLMVADDPGLPFEIKKSREWLWLPETCSGELRDSVVSLFQLKRSSEFVTEIFFDESTSGALVNLEKLSNIRPQIIGFIRRENPLAFQKCCQQAGRIAALAHAPLVPVNALALTYHLQNQPPFIERRAAIIADEAIYIDDKANIESIALDFQRALPGITSLEEVLAYMFSKTGTELSAYLRRKGYLIEDDVLEMLKESYCARREGAHSQSVQQPTHKTANVVGGIHSAAEIVDERKSQVGPGEGADGTAGSQRDIPLRDSESNASSDSQSVNPPDTTMEGVPYSRRTSYSTVRGRNISTVPADSSYQAGQPGNPTNTSDASNQKDGVGSETDEDEDDNTQVRKTRTILRSINLEDGFLRLPLDGLNVLGASRPTHIRLENDFQSITVDMMVDYGQGILHCAPERISEFRSLLESQAVVPGAVLEIERTNDPLCFHIHPVWLSNPKVIKNVVFWTEGEDGYPQQEITPEVSFEFDVHEPSYRAERRWEEPELCNQLKQERVIGVRQEIENVLRDAAKGMKAADVHKELLLRNHPCAYFTVQSILNDLPMLFHQDKNGCWYLGPAPNIVHPSPAKEEHPPVPADPDKCPRENDSQRDSTHSLPPEQSLSGESNPLPSNASQNLAQQPCPNESPPMKYPKSSDVFSTQGTHGEEVRSAQVVRAGGSAVGDGVDTPNNGHAENMEFNRKSDGGNHSVRVVGELSAPKPQDVDALLSQFSQACMIKLDVSAQFSAEQAYYVISELDHTVRERGWSLKIIPGDGQPDKQEET